ncbi:hypothetical protein FJM51_10050 [Amaricoccus solimangrovi]|uniref:Uncharacterized protein n=1 Tax=Amaricoccus solimangrovi TaxID=2589815 RepID=A0A501WYG1_9RHOB|nr:hypothetical protein FJM51_10050 [Amaricoccus solimangrovi]
MPPLRRLNEETAIPVIDETGATIWRGKRASDPDALTTTPRRHAPDLARVGLETGPLTPLLSHTCEALGLPILCLDARHARTATASQRNMGVAIDLSNQIRGALKTFGLMAGKGAGRALENRVRELIQAGPIIAAIIEPPWRHGRPCAARSVSRIGGLSPWPKMMRPAAC